jgi:1,2-diacylglycerol 3-alpha-glucosyltransferase
MTTFYEGMTDIGDTPRLKIAFIADTFAGVVPSGGVVAAQRLVRALRSHHEVIVASADASGPDCVRFPGFQLPVRSMRDQGFFMAVPRSEAIARLIADVDLVHLQFPFWLSMAALAEARRAGKPVIAAFHVQPENALQGIGLHAEWASNAMYRFWVQRFYNKADAVICPSRFARLKLRAHGLHVPAFVISNGVAAPSVSRLPRREADPWTILMLGRLAPEKRQELLIEAVRRSKHSRNIRVVIAGKGPREAELRALGSTLPIPAEVGYLDDERLASVRATADLFVHCSDVELEGMAVLEAMSAGIPVLVAEGPQTAASEFAPGPRFKFPAGDAAALTARLDDLLDNPLLLRAASTRCTQVARALDLDHSLAKVESAYRFVLAAGEDRRDSALPNAQENLASTG